MATPPHLRKLVFELSKHPAVYRANLSVNEVSIKYRNGLAERWIRDPEQFKSNCCWIYYLPDPPGSPFDEFRIGRQFESNELEEDHEEKQKYFSIRVSDYMKSEFAARRVSIHSLIDLLIDQGWIGIKHPHECLIDDFVRFRSDSPDRFDRHQIEVHGYGSRVYHGLRILEHFVPWGSFGNEKSIAKAWQRPFNIYSAISHLIKIKQDITRASIAKVLRVSAYGGGIRMYAPNLYRSIFKKFDISGSTIADPNPGIGSKALASAACSCSYYYGDGPFAKSANDISKFLGASFSRIEERDKFDVVILDSNWNTDIHKLLADIDRWRDKADMLLIYVPKECYESIKSTYMPISTCRINVEFLYHDSPDWLMLI